MLLVSLDRAHSLADILDVPRSTEVRHVTTGLDVLEIDSLRLLERRYAALSTLAQAAGGHDHAGSFVMPAPEELTGLPGVEDLLALTEVTRLADSGRWSTIVVDGPASSAALAMLSAPHTVSSYMDRIWPPHSRIEASIGADARLTMVVALFDRALAGIAGVQELLDDRARTSAVLVATPDRAGHAELRRLRSWTALAGLRSDTVIVNGLTPDLAGEGPAANWLAEQRAAQESVLSDIRDSVGEIRVIACERAENDPVGSTCLDALGRSLWRGQEIEQQPGEDGPGPVRVWHESGTGVESVYSMRMHLPVADPSTLTLGRVSDDLLIGADGMRRRIRLASVLRRCTVSAAEFDGGDLMLRFVPDPAVWPR